MKGGRPEWIWSWQPKVAGKGTSGGVKILQTNHKRKRKTENWALLQFDSPHRPLFPDNQQTTRVPSRV